MASLILIVTVDNLEEDTDMNKIKEEVDMVLNEHYTYSNVYVELADDC